MPGTHGDLYSEIGRLVVAANSGRTLDLESASEDLSRRYANLGFPPAAMARAIARSLGAVGVSMAMLNHSRPPAHEAPIDVGRVFGPPAEALFGTEAEHDGDEPKAPSLFPSGVRLALLS